MEEDILQPPKLNQHPITHLDLVRFRVFDHLQLSRISPSTVIVGANGSGKTSILWAVVLLLRAYNAITVNSNAMVDNTTPRELIIGTDEISQLLNFRPLSGTGTKLGEAFVNNKATMLEPGAMGLLGGTINGQKGFECALQRNGVITLIPPKLDSAPLEKIRFAFMGIEAHWICADESYTSPILTSERGNLRNRYIELTTERQEQVKQHLREMLGIEDLVRNDDPGLYLVQNGARVEIMYTGAAFRKVFAVLVLLYTLLQAPESKRVFLIEEPETLLYPTLQRKFMGMLLAVTKAENVQLFVTTNSDTTLKFFSKSETLVLFDEDTVWRADHADWVEKAICWHLLDTRPIPIIVCEGEHDPLFIERLAPLFGLSTKGVQLPPKGSAGLNANEAVHKLTIDHLQPRSLIRFLLDRDFRVKIAPETKKQRSLKFYWSLPSIESYLLWYHCEKHKGDAESPLRFFLDATWQSWFTQKYLNSFVSQNAKPRNVHTPRRRTQARSCLDAPDNRMAGGEKRDDSAVISPRADEAEQCPGYSMSDLFGPWEAAMAAARKQNPTTEDILAVVKVVHGHTWVKMVMKTSTPVLLTSVGSDIQQLCPELGKELAALLAFRLMDDGEESTATTQVDNLQLPSLELV